MRIGEGRGHRLRLSGSYFELTDRFASRADAARGTRHTAAAVDMASASADLEPRPIAEPRIVISVAKRLVPSAVRRNMVKRIVREAWRASRAQRPQSARKLPAGIASTIGMTASPTGAARICLVRLRHYPGAGAHAAMPPPGLVTIKRALRADADRLFAALLRDRRFAAGLSAASDPI